MNAVEFDKWFEGEMPNSHKKVNKERIETAIYSCAEAAWDYQQSKIDILEVQLKGAEERAKLALDHKNKMVDELQARVDAAEKWIELNRKTIALEYSGYTTEEYVDADDLLDILKGNKDEN